MVESGPPALDTLVVGDIRLGPDRELVTRIHSGRVPRSKADLLQRLLGVIASRQRAFMEFGLEWLWADTQSALADAVGVNAATISRIRPEWSIETPHGIIPVRAFMDSGVTMVRGSKRISRLAVEAALRRLIGSEDADNPHTDDDLVALLADAGVAIARRTVAKYRAAAGIPSAHERRRSRPVFAGADLQRFQKKSSGSTRKMTGSLTPEERAEKASRNQIEGILRWAALPGIEIPDERHARPPQSRQAKPSSRRRGRHQPGQSTPPPPSSDPVRCNLVVRALLQILASLPSADAIPDRDLVRLLRYRGLDVPIEEVQLIRGRIAG
jgi:Sigma-54, DNA binding domain